MGVTSTNFATLSKSNKRILHVSFFHTIMLTKKEKTFTKEFEQQHLLGTLLNS